jgi:hypothetical protein
MKYFAPLAALAVVGHAKTYTATFTSSDGAGRSLDATSVDFTPGESFSMSLDLQVYPQLRDTLTVVVPSYGVSSCQIMATSQGGTKALANDLTMCDFPYHSFSSGFTGKIGLQNNQFLQSFNGDITVNCMSTDVTTKKDKVNTTCGASSEDSVKNNAAHHKFFEIRHRMKSEIKEWEMFLTIGSWIAAAGDILQFSSNDCLTAVIDEAELFAMEEQYWGIPWWTMISEYKHWGWHTGGKESYDKLEKKMKKTGKKVTKSEMQWWEAQEYFKDIVWASHEFRMFIDTYNCAQPVLSSGDWSDIFTNWSDPYWLNIAKNNIFFNYSSEIVAEAYFYLFDSSLHGLVFLFGVANLFLGPRASVYGFDALDELPRLINSIWRTLALVIEY